MSESDDLLMRLFASAPPPEKSEEFVASVADRIGRARRRGGIVRIGAFAALAAAAAWATPFLAGGSVALAGRLASGIPVFGAALTSPAGWAGSIVIALWCLRRLRTLGR